MEVLNSRAGAAEPGEVCISFLPEELPLGTVKPGAATESPLQQQARETGTSVPRHDQSKQRGDAGVSASPAMPIAEPGRDSLRFPGSAWRPCSDVPAV